MKQSSSHHAQLCYVGGCSTDFILRDNVDIKFIISWIAESWIISASVAGKTNKRISCQIVCDVLCKKVCTFLEKKTLIRNSFPLETILFYFTFKLFVTRITIILHSLLFGI